VLSEEELRIWDQIERDYWAEADAPPRDRRWTWRRPRHSEGRVDVPAVVVGGGWAAVLLVLFGVPSGGVAVGAAAALIWLLWRFFPQVDGDSAAEDPEQPLAADSLPVPGNVGGRLVADDGRS
jgi:hypothetical protein